VVSFVVTKARRRQTIFVGSRIRQFRKERRLTQAELAQRIGVQQSDLCRMENGEYRVSLDVLFKILGVFGMDIGEFFEDEFPAPAATDRDREILRLLQRLDEPAKLEILDFLRYKALHRSNSSR
jgi:transcriptional regulator with XRE-family HTH domain